MKKKKKKKNREIVRARESVVRAGQKLTDRLARLERVADGIESAAVDRFVASAVAELVEDQLLRDVADLQSALASTAAGALPGEIEPFRRLPEAIQRWLRSRFGLTPYLEAGKVMQVPSEKLEGFVLAGSHWNGPAGRLVRIKVLAPGWKRGADVVVPPRVELIE